MSPMDKREETYHMTDKEMARVAVAERLIEGEITFKGAAEMLGMHSMRQALASFKGLPYIIVLYNRSN